MKTQWEPESYGDFLLMNEWRSIVNSGKKPYMPPGYGLVIGAGGVPRLRTMPLNTQKVREAELPDKNDWGRFTINPEK